MKRGCGGGRWWEALSPEILALIFVRIPADQMVKTVPLVCRSWREVVAGPYCWAEINVAQWCRRSNRTEEIDAAVRRLVRRSKGTLRSLSAYKLGNSAFSFIANSGRFLKVLQIPMSDITDTMVEKHAESLAMVTVLDISYCLKITCKGLEALGKHCKSLVHLKRNMPPEESESSIAEEGEAMTIADTMPGLHHLELCYGRFSDDGLTAILTKCRSLDRLDIQGCWKVKLEGNLEERCAGIANFTNPWDNGYDDATDDGDGGTDVSDDDSCSNYSD